MAAVSPVNLNQMLGQEQNQSCGRWDMTERVGKNAISGDFSEITREIWKLRDELFWHMIVKRKKRIQARGKNLLNNPLVFIEAVIRSNLFCNNQINSLWNSSFGHEIFHLQVKFKIFSLNK